MWPKPAGSGVDDGGDEQSSRRAVAELDDGDDESSRRAVAELAPKGARRNSIRLMTLRARRARRASREAATAGLFERMQPQGDQTRKGNS